MPKNKAPRRILRWILLSLGLLLALVAFSLIYRSGPPQSPSEYNMYVHPIFGWAPFIPDELAEKGLKIEQTIGQNLEVIDQKKKHVVVIQPSAAGLARTKTKTQSIAQLLRTKITEHQVLDATVLAHGLDQILVYLENKLPSLNASALIIELSPPHVEEPHRTNNFMGLYKPFYNVVAGKLVRVNPDLPRHACIDHFAESLFFSFIWKRATKKHGQKGRSKVARFLSDFCRAPRLSPEQGREVLEHLMDAIYELTQRHKLPVLFVLAPKCERSGECTSTLYERPAWFQPHPWLAFFRSIVLERGWAHVDVSRALEQNPDCVPDSNGVLSCERERPFEPKKSSFDEVRAILLSKTTEFLNSHSVR